MLNQLTLSEAVKKLETKKISLAELYRDVNQEIAKQNSQLNVYLELDSQAAAKAENQIGTPLAGAPIAVKDNFCTPELITTASSTVLKTFKPPFASTVTKKLEAAGGVIIGKTNLDAWAHGSSTETSQFGRTLNPRNHDYLPGGSSGGSAAAVAADLCLAAIGSETAGSIRQPSAWCGTVGLKPTYGRVSRYGVVAMASSTDSPGPITKTVADGAQLLNVLAGHDVNDGTTSPQPVPDFSALLGQSIKGLKIGMLYVERPGLETIRPHYEAAAAVLRSLGAQVELASAFDPYHAIGVYTVVQRAEVSSNLARYDGVRYGTDRSVFGAEAKRRIMLGTYTLSKGYADQYYVKAQKVRTLYKQDFDKLFTAYDILMSPTSPGFAKKIGASENGAMFGELEDMLLEPTSITGLPGINVPCYRDPETNLFLGLNIVAPMWQEARMIQVADAFEGATTWNTWRHHD